MDNDVSKSWSLPFQEAVKDIMRDKTCYVTKDELELRKTADPEPWDPSERFRQIVPSFDNIELEFIDKSTSLQQVRNHLREEKDVGLVVLGPVIDRKSEPSLIIMTTSTKLYAIDPKDTNKALRFLAVVLIDSSLNFWTTNGLEEADCLYGNYEIDLSSGSTNVKCCSGMSAHLMKLIKSFPLAFKSTFSPWALTQSERRGQNYIDKFEDMIEMWLDIDMADVGFSKDQLPHLNTRPLNTTAINIIKKRCMLVLPLAKELERLSWLEVGIMSGNIHGLLTTCNHDKSMRQVMETGMRQSLAQGKVAHVGYYSHLDMQCRDKENKYIDKNVYF